MITVALTIDPGPHGCNDGLRCCPQVDHETRSCRLFGRELRHRIVLDQIQIQRLPDCLTAEKRFDMEVSLHISAAIHQTLGSLA